jgi:uncharacterized membrane protein (DUF106 family)
MSKKIDNKAQGSNMLLLLLMMVLMFFVFTQPAIQIAMISFGNAVFYPLIGFEGQYPIITLFLAGLIVVFLSSSLTNFFTDWVKMGEAQEIQKAFSKEMQKARREGNTNKVNKLMKMQPEMMKKQTEASSGMMKPMIFLIIFIWPIFMWLRYFLAGLPHYYFSVPWAENVSFFSVPFSFGQSWIWLYFIFSIAIGQIIRQGLKYISWSDWWKNTKQKIRPSASK